MKNICLTKRFESSAGEIAYDSFGEGTDVILVHGTPTNAAIWSDTLEQLQDRFRVHLFDLPGYGASAKFDGQDVRLRSFARTLRELIEHLGLKRPHLVGHDFGAATVMGAYLIEQVDIASIAVADGVVLSPWGTPFSRHVKNNEQVFAVVPEYVHRAVLEAHLDSAVSRRLSGSDMSLLINPWLGEVGQHAYYRQVAQYDYEFTSLLEQHYANINVPALVLWGEDDRWVDISEGHRLAEMIPGAIMETLPDAGHFSMLDVPTLFNRKLKRWLIEQEN